MKKNLILIILFFLFVLESKTQDITTAINFYNNANYEKALDELDYLYKDVRNKYGASDTVLYPTVLFYIGKCYESLDDYFEAEFYYFSILDIYKNIDNGTENLKYAFYCQNLANYLVFGDYYDEAETIYFETLDLYLKKFDKNNEKILQCKNDLAYLYIKTGNYNEAEEILIEIKNICLNSQNKISNIYTITCSNLCFLYDEKGDYEKVEPIYLENLSICEKLFSKNSEKYITISNNLASFYVKLGNYPKAKFYLDENLKLSEKTFGKTHYLFGFACGELGLFYEKTNDFTKAEEMYLNAKNIIENALGSDNKYYRKICINLAFFYTLISNYDKAEYYFNEAEIVEIYSAQDSLEFANQNNKLGLFYFENDKFFKAEKCYLNALPIYESLLGKEHLDYTNLITNLASLYYNYEDYRFAEEYILEANSNYKNHIIRTGFFMSDRERELFLKNKIGNNFDFFTSFFFKQKEKRPSLTDNCYDNALLMKGLLLRSNIALRQAVFNSQDKKLIKLYNSYLVNSKTLLELQNKPIKDKKIKIDNLIDTINFQEKELYKSPIFKNSQKFDDLKWQNVQKSLNENEVAIEFINFKLFDFQLTDSVYYCALIITKNCKNPKMIYLFEEKEIFNIFKTFNEKEIELYKNLYSLIIEPIIKSLKNTSKIYFSSSGLLNNVSFCALLSPKDIYFGDEFDIVQLTSTSNIIKKESDLYFDKSWNTVIFGGADFGKNSKNIETPFNYLSGTKNEAENIIKIIESNKAKFTLFTGKNFTETTFKQLSKNKPEIIHIATHGFYNQNNKEIEKNLVVREEKQITLRNDENMYIFAENPMLRSGLAFSNANITAEKNEVLIDKDDGILTSFELSNLYFGNTKLVVLSACKTGLGDIQSSEGIYGLQRALKMAGVKFIIMSLWSVPDVETEQLMSDFYKIFVEGKEIHEAFRLAQNNLKIKYPNEPFYWAGFILIQ